MSSEEDKVRHLFGASIEAKMANADVLSALITQAGNRLVQTLLNEGKILLCGNGGSAAIGSYFSSMMMHRFEVERPPLPVIALNKDMTMITAAISDNQHDYYARQIQALGQEKDILLIITTSGNAENILQAVSAAKDRGIDIIVLAGRDGGLLSNHLGPEDIELRVQHDSLARVSEVHLLVLNCFCNLIDQALFGFAAG